MQHLGLFYLSLTFRYYSFIIDYKKLHEENANDSKLERNKPFFRRALYTVGLLLRHFDLSKEEVRCGLQVGMATSFLFRNC